MLTNKTVDRESQQKLYVQMFSIIKDKIEQREWPAGSQIPTEDELCTTYDVSKATVRMAIAELVRSGYLRKQQGKGTFVSHALPDLGITMKTKLTEDMFGEGVVARKEVLVKGVKVPPEVVPDIEEADVCLTPFYEMMQQRARKKIQKVIQMIEIAEMTGDAAAILKSEKGAPMLLLHRLLVGADGKPLAYTRLMGDGKKYKLQTELIQIA